LSAGRTVRIVPLAGGEHRRHHDRAGMHRPALEGVVEILAMRGRAVHQRGARGAQVRAWPIAVHGPSSSQPASVAAT
jgi:hypothetical protein